MHPRRTFGYARVSSVEQALGTSLDDQQNVIRAYAQKRGLKVDRMYVEAESAVHEKIERRVQIQALMAEVRTGDLVLVDKLDRWSRDPEFTYGSIRQILERGANFFAVGDDCDPSTPQGDSMMGLRILFAREEHKRIRQRMVGTRRLLRDRGYYVDGLAPWGYKRPEGRLENRLDRNVLIVDKIEAERVLDVFRRCIEGESIDEIAEAVGSNRYRVHDTLRNRVYLGQIRSTTGQWIRAKHAPLIDAHTFTSALAAIDRRRKGDRRANPVSETGTWWLRDRARCALCSAKMSAAYAGPSGARRYYFRCYAQCTSRYVRVSVAEAVCSPLVLVRLVELRDDLALVGRPSKASALTTDVAAKRAKLEQRRARYVEAYADGGMPREELRAKLEKLDEDRMKLDALEAAPMPVTDAQLRTALRSVAVIERAWNASTAEERRTLFNGLAHAVYLAADKRPRIEWVSAEDLARRA